MGRVALAKFQANPHHHLNMLEMQGKHGMLRIFGDKNKALACAEAAREAFEGTNALQATTQDDKLLSSQDEKESPEAPSQPALKKIKVDETIPEEYGPAVAENSHGKPPASGNA